MGAALFPLGCLADTEQPGWVLGNVPLSCLDLQSQLHLRQKMGDRGFSQLGEEYCHRGEGEQQVSMDTLLYTFPGHLALAGSVCLEGQELPSAASGLGELRGIQGWAGQWETLPPNPPAGGDRQGCLLPSHQRLKLPHLMAIPPPLPGPATPINF